MKMPALILTAVLAAGCAVSSTGGTAAAPSSPEPPKRDRNGCATAAKGLIAYSEMREGAQNQTMTPSDMAGKMKTIAEKMDDVALIAAPELAADAKAAALAAGHLRVALLGQGDFDVAAENSTLGEKLDAVALYCKA